MNNTEFKVLQGPEVYGFFGPFRFLSNFHFKQVQYDGVFYKTNEHAYQAAKTLNLEDRIKIKNIESPKDARKAGQLVQYRDDWENIKWSVMYDLNCQKFSYGELLRNLLNTGTSHLEETNWWGDVYWGVCNGKGENQLGKILMLVRSELRELTFMDAYKILLEDPRIPK